MSATSAHQGNGGCPVVLGSAPANHIAGAEGNRGCPCTPLGPVHPPLRSMRQPPGSPPLLPSSLRRRRRLRRLPCCTSQPAPQPEPCTHPRPVHVPLIRPLRQLPRSPPLRRRLCCLHTRRHLRRRHRRFPTRPSPTPPALALAPAPAPALRCCPCLLHHTPRASRTTLAASRSAV